MIISQIIGGLGNQMFQYAIGRALTLESGGQLRLDVSGFNNYALHQGFELLDVFNLVPEVMIASKEEMQTILNWRSNTTIKKILARPIAKNFRNSRFVVEPHFNYWNGIKNVQQDCYLVGYWQSERYFRAATSVLRTDFTFKSPLVGQNAELEEKIHQKNAVSLHVRRGDYVKNKKTNQTHGLCSIEYYKKSIQYIKEHVDNPYFFIFSDDILWAKKNLNLELPHIYIQNNVGVESYNDMHLMSLCDHHIIANSSFSWWGAWLNTKADKIVIGPSKWFANEINVADIFPQKWLRL